MAKCRGRKPVVSNPQYADAYKKEHAQALKTGVCPFDKPEFRAKGRVLKRYGGWFICYSQYPPNDRLCEKPDHYFLIIKEKHTSVVTPRDGAAVIWLMRWAMRKYKLKGVGLGGRIGEPLFSGSTLSGHAHIHLCRVRLVRTLGKNSRLVAVPVDFPFG